MKKLVAQALAVSLAAFALAGCAGDSQTETKENEGVTMESVVEAGTILDVRTPAEYAEGHLEGAVNIDVTDPGFEDAIASLDPNGAYSVYCRSGQRSGKAVAIMEQKGFKNVTNVGGVQDASATLGIDIVK
ncbi:sulfurtransferase [Actinomyces sp. S6-Spd3]|uniref:rhodanese-like domain-containing protein n=1 Tax=unclassified Actinomyces TaxID=2609248 RepID=UPI00050FBBB6|nr:MULTISPECIES: rhodanese-like domain-containing protein [unclassified Actinomyces]KGF01647.1 sulfurtransferase [Actinomyces sp. S4-C9]KGF05791.1 sulfurtransferase [Actinomyces sp. S6-Spd3]